MLPKIPHKIVILRALKQRTRAIPYFGLLQRSPTRAKPRLKQPQKKQPNGMLCPPHATLKQHPNVAFHHKILFPKGFDATEWIKMEIEETSFIPTGVGMLFPPPGSLNRHPNVAFFNTISVHKGVNTTYMSRSKRKKKRKKSPHLFNKAMHGTPIGRQIRTPLHRVVKQPQQLRRKLSWHVVHIHIQNYRSLVSSCHTVQSILRPRNTLLLLLRLGEEAMKRRQKRILGRDRTGGWIIILARTGGPSCLPDDPCREHEW